MTDQPITYTHRLVLPSDANHRDTFYAGSLLRLALEACYATGVRCLGSDANIALRRVLSLECYRPVPVGELVEVQSVCLHTSTAYFVIGFVGMPIVGESEPWMDGLMGFAQIDEHGRPAPLPQEVAIPTFTEPHWKKLSKRLEKLLTIR